MIRPVAAGISILFSATLAACASGPGAPGAAKSPERVAAERACTYRTYERYSGEGWSQRVPVEVVDQSCVRQRLSGNR